MKWLNELREKINNAQQKQRQKKLKQAQEVKTKPNDVFQRAITWADEEHSALVTGKKRYQMAFLTSMGLCCLLTLAVVILAPMQQLIPMLVNHYPDGRVAVLPFNQKTAPIHTPLVESDIVRYVINRESYNASSYNEQYQLVSLLSNNKVTQAYANSQEAGNANSPVRLLGNEGTRRVHIDSLVFLDKQSLNKPNALNQHHVNLAQVNFTLTTTKNNATQKPVPLTALISWTYLGTPQDPTDLWRNPYGFTVTRFSVSQRNV